MSARSELTSTPTRSAPGAFWASAVSSSRWRSGRNTSRGSPGGLRIEPGHARGKGWIARRICNAKIGDPARVAALEEALTRHGEAVGLKFRFDLIERMPNSRRSHLLIAHAARHGLQARSNDRVMQAFFEEGWISAIMEELVRLGVEGGSFRTRSPLCARIARGAGRRRCGRAARGGTGHWRRADLHIRRPIHVIRALRSRPQWRACSTRSRNTLRPATPHLERGGIDRARPHPCGSHAGPRLCAARACGRAFPAIAPGGPGRRDSTWRPSAVFAISAGSSPSGMANTAATRPLYDAARTADRLPPRSHRDERIEAILRWSALPGASRHHLGHRLDLIDARAVASDYQVQFVPGGIRAAAARSRRSRIGLRRNAPRFGFFRPFRGVLSGVQAEPWHFSFAPRRGSRAAGARAGRAARPRSSAAPLHAERRMCLAASRSACTLRAIVVGNRPRPEDATPGGAQAQSVFRRFNIKPRT